VFFDSNVFLRYLAGDGEARRLVDRVEAGEWSGYVNDVVVSEVVYGYLRLVLDVSRYELRRYVVEHVDEVGGLLEEDVLPLFTVFSSLPCHVGASMLMEYMVEYKLLPNDALIAATCRIHDVRAIAAFDEDFKRIPWLRVLSQLWTLLSWK